MNPPRRRRLGRWAAAIALSGAVATNACSSESDADIASRAAVELARYRTDPLAAPVDIGLEQGTEPTEIPAERHPDNDDHPLHDGTEASSIEYWFVVPAGSDRGALLDAAAAQLEARGWTLRVSNDGVKVLSADPGVDHLEARLVMPQPDSDRLLQEIQIRS